MWGRRSGGTRKPHEAHLRRHHTRWRAGHTRIRPKVRVVVIEPGGVPESFGKWIGVDFQLGDQLVLVGRHRREYRLWEHVSVVIFSF